MFRYGLLVCLLVGWAATQDMDTKGVKESQFPKECQKLVAKFNWCGERQNWTNLLQEHFAKVLSSEAFINRTTACMRTAYEVGKGTVACTEFEPMEIMLHCSRMSLFHLVSVEKKYAAIKFHTGFQHCVKKEMGFRPEATHVVDVYSPAEDADNPIDPEGEADEYASHYMKKISPTAAPVNEGGEGDDADPAIHTLPTTKAAREIEGGEDDADPAIYTLSKAKGHFGGIKRDVDHGLKEGPGEVVGASYENSAAVGGSPKKGLGARYPGAEGNGEEEQLLE